MVKLRGFTREFFYIIFEAQGLNHAEMNSNGLRENQAYKLITHKLTSLALTPAYIIFNST